ncbi:MAG: serine/threonine protein kinase [Prevotella sp.]|nr:serine/threonine protein kinase [Prevotella sp.]
MHLKKGFQLQNGKYTIERVLGQGGFGITYQASTQDGVIVAVKEFFMDGTCVRDAATSFVSVPSEGAKEDVDQYRQKFVKEANRLLQLNHPHIVKVYDVFEENGTNYYVMENVGGGSLRENILRDGPMSEEKAKETILQVASALQYMHSEKHICHYDVKPSNILLDEDGNAILIDFGLSKNYDEYGQETSSTPIGLSKGFAPIEQYQQSLSDFSPPTDIYALGATFYFLLSGKTPPEASEVLEHGLPFLETLSPNTWQTIQKAMQPLRRNRFQTVDDFCRFLENEMTVVRAPRPTHPVQPETSYPSESKDSQNRIILWIVILLLLALLMVVGLLLMKKNRSSAYGNNNEAVVETVTDSSEPERTIHENPRPTKTQKTWNGSFIIRGKSYPVRLSFHDNNGVLSNCVYTNVGQGGQLKLQGSRSGSVYTFTGDDGSYPLIITVSETATGHFEGTATGQYDAVAVFGES